ncbi:hypothetical protein [Microbacterium sp. CPCC 204701]|uniref:hypothetical protein n=1 Tax=Microbacterium sp. CPCC 204701 TaxID=2493084 RepID=UPI000FD6BA92|nr:hypothetical protein [Microbacterium sp. CPCC 204701]
MTTAPVRSGRRTGDLTATLLLIGLSVGTAVVLFFNALLWALGGADNSGAIALGGYLPLAFTVLGAVAGIVALAGRRTGFWYPLVALVLSIVVWLVAISLVR